MLSGIEPSKIKLGHFGAPSMTNPNPVKAYVETFSEEEQAPVREHVSNKLKKMLYVKHLEEMLNIYDLYSYEEEKKIDEATKKFVYMSNIKPTFSFIMSSAFVTAFLLYKKASPLQFETYLKNFYSVAGIWGFSYTFLSCLLSGGLASRNKEIFRNSVIVSAKSQLHSEAVSLTNELRFSPEEAL